MINRFPDLSLTDIIKKSRSARLPDQCGIYFLLRRNVVVYVGQTEWFWQRLRAHMIDERKEWDRYYFVKLPVESLNEAEHHFILKFKPQYNHYRPHTRSTAAAQLIAYPHRRNRRGPPSTQDRLF